MNVADWLSAEQQLLLKACFVQNSEGLRAWQQWSAQIEFDHLDFASMGLIPLLYDRLSHERVKDPNFGKYKSLYKYHWLAGQLFLKEMDIALQVLRSEDIKYVLFKGVGLVLGCGLRPALRPVYEIDLLLHPDDAMSASDSIRRKAGWKAADSDGDRLHQRFISPGRYALNIYHDLLRWRLASQGNMDRLRGDCMNMPTIVVSNGQQISVMPVTCELLHCCVQVIREREMSVRWLADAALRIKHASVDWDLLIEQARRLRLVLPLLLCLRYIKLELKLTVPPHVLGALEAVSIPRLERWYCRLLVSRYYPELRYFVSPLFGAKYGQNLKRL